MVIHSVVAFVASGTTREGLVQILPQSAAGFLFGKNVAAKRLSDFYLAANLNFSTPSADAQCTSGRMRKQTQLKIIPVPTLHFSTLEWNVMAIWVAVDGFLLLIECIFGECIVQIPGSNCSKTTFLNTWIKCNGNMSGTAFCSSLNALWMYCANPWV